MGRRDEDPVLSEHVRERLAHLLAEQRPRRAQVALSTPALLAPSRARTGQHDDGPDYAPSDDDDSESVGHTTARVTEPGPSWSATAMSASDTSAGSHSLWRFGRAHLGVVVALLVVGLVFAGWSVLRARPVAMANPVAVPSVAQPSAPGNARTPGAGASPSRAPAPTPQIMVHVLGAVREPGVVTLAPTARVRDALTAAGGLTKAADPGELNLAQLLSDGQQIVIGTRQKPTGQVRSGSAGGGPSSGAAGAASQAVDLNGASQAQLEELPGVGPVTAAKIVAWRTEHGRFSRVEELQEVDGIGPKTYAEIAPHARV